MDCVFLIALAIPSFSFAAEVVPLRGSFCLGEPAEWTCTANNSLRWSNEPIGAAGPLITVYTASDSYTLPERDLASVGPIRVVVTCLRGTEFLSRARVNMTSSLDGTRLECAGTGESFSLAGATVDLSVTEPANISYLTMQLISENVIIFHWGGAQCASYYRIEINDVNGITVNTTTETNYKYMIPQNNNDRIIITVHGVDFTGNNFTNITKTLTGPHCNASLILPDNNGVLHIVVERDNDDHFPVRSCDITFNSTTHDCSGNKVIVYDYIPPGEYPYNVEMSNAIGSTVCDNGIATVSSSTVSSSTVSSSTVSTSTVSSSTVSTSTVSTSTSTVTPSPTTTTTTIPVTTCPPPTECKLPLWAIIVMVVLGALLVLAVVFYVWKLWWRHRCCCRKCFCEDEDCCCQNSCCQGCWDSPFSTYFFCECFKKDKRETTLATANLRTKSPDEKDMMISSIEKDMPPIEKPMPAFIEKDMSKM